MKVWFRGKPLGKLWFTRINTKNFANNRVENNVDWWVVRRNLFCFNSQVPASTKNIFPLAFPLRLFRAITKILLNEKKILLTNKWRATEEERKKETDFTNFRTASGERKERASAWSEEVFRSRFAIKNQNIFIRKKSLIEIQFVVEVK